MLRCVSCGKTYTPKTGRQICGCGEPLELEYFSGKIKSGKTSWAKYRDFLPFDPSRELSLSEGGTPMIKANRLSKKYDVDLHLKNETVNPTWSFKDRGTVLSLQRARKLGVGRVGTVSTGNMGASVAAYGKRAGLDPMIMVTEDISDGKLNQIAVYGATIVEVSGDYGELFYESLDLSREDDQVYFSNSNSPYRIEGYKTIAFESVERLMPEYVMIPTSSGGLFRGMMKGFIEMDRCGIIDDIPVLISVQAEGCSPIYRAFRDERGSIKRWKEPKTVASAIANPYPPGGNEVLRKLDEYRGICTVVSDDEINSAQRKIVTEGIFCQPASTVGVAAVKKLRQNDAIEKGSKVVSIITGSGLKHISKNFIQPKVYSCEMSELEKWFERELER
ncbi:MAG: threonine synthase [Candidatus Thermoplasmatota archaeon]